MDRKIYKESFEGNLKGLELYAFGEDNHFMFKKTRDHLITEGKTDNIASFLEDYKVLTYLHVEEYYNDIFIWDSNVFSNLMHFNKNKNEEEYNKMNEYIDKALNYIDVYIVNKIKMTNEIE